MYTNQLLRIQMKINHKIVKFINQFRNQYEKNKIIYSNGGCYQFQLLLNQIFPGEIVYDYKNGHSYFKHNDIYYDINGYHFKIEQEISHYEMYNAPHKPYRWKYKDG